MNTLYHTRKPKTTRKIHEEFTLKNATVFGGYNLLADYVTAKHVETLLRESIGIEKAAWSTYDLPFVLRYLMEGYLLGMERTKHFETLENENLIAQKLGVCKLPDYTILGKDLRKFTSEEHVAGLKAAGRKLIRKKLKNKRNNVVLDFDSTVETVYGEQEGAAAGYNPKKPGRLSFNPLLCFEATEDLHIDSVLRSGDTHTAAGSVPFMEEVESALRSVIKRYDILTAKGKVLCRFDEGFDKEETYSTAERLGWGYVAKIRCFAPLKLDIFGIRVWKKVIGSDRDIEVASLFYQAGSWDRARRIVIVRWKDEGGTQGSFFDEMDYNYVAFVTNLDWSEEDLYRFYNNRGTVENRIKEAKYGFGIDKIPTNEFYANYAALALKMMAYNIISLFQAEVMEMGILRMSIRGIRRMFFTIAGRLITRGRKRILQLADDYQYTERYLRMRERLAGI